MNSLDGAHCNPLQIACSHGNVVGTKALCKYGAQPDEKSLLAAVGSRDDHSRLSIVRYLLDIAAMEPSIHGSQASVIANQAVSNGPADAAALILQRQKAKGTTVTIPDSSWLQAAEHVTDDDPLLQHFPLKIPATAVAIGRAWRTRKDRRISGSSQGGFSDDGSDERQHQQLPHSTTTDLLKRVCKGMITIAAQQIKYMSHAFKPSWCKWRAMVDVSGMTQCIIGEWESALPCVQCTYIILCAQACLLSVIN